MGYIPAAQSLKNLRDYPVEEEQTVMLKDKRTVLLRPAVSSDGAEHPQPVPQPVGGGREDALLPHRARRFPATTCSACATSTSRTRSRSSR